MTPDDEAINLNLVVLSYPQDAPGLRILERFLTIFTGLGFTSQVITSSAVGPLETRWRVPFPREPGLLGYAALQLRLAQVLIQNRKSWDAACLIVGGTAMVLPALTTRMLGRPAYLIVAGSAALAAEQTHGRRSLYTRLLQMAERATIKIVFRVVTYGPAAARSLGIAAMRPDVLTNGAEFVNGSFSSRMVPIRERPQLIGFVGRLSQEKGVVNLLEAVARLASEMPNLTLDLIGDGPQRNLIANLVKEHPLGVRLHLHGWIDQRELPAYYARMRLLVVPSYTEGLPNVMLEAMACGTPVLVTRVGGVPDIIVDGANGFLLDGNSAESLLQALRMILAKDVMELERVAEQARQTIERSFGLNKAVERYASIFSILE